MSSHMEVLSYLVYCEERDLFISRMISNARNGQLANSDLVKFEEIMKFYNKPPASKSEIKKLRTQQDELLGEQCCICLSQYKVKDKAFIMPCNHIFHKTCLNKWFKKSNFCPMCKFELKTDDMLYEMYKELMKNQQT